MFFCFFFASFIVQQFFNIAQYSSIMFHTRVQTMANSFGYLRLPHGLLAAGPPCSLFVWLCCSVHQRFRNGFGCRGNEQNLKTKLANFISENLVACKDEWQVCFGLFCDLIWFVVWKCLFFLKYFDLSWTDSRPFVFWPFFGWCHPYKSS